MEILLQRKAFTLAEVLITLGIIGIVAAITIPPLMNNIQEKQFREAAKEAYSKASQAVNQMRQDNGGDLTYYRTGGTFKPEFIKYFKVVQDCNPTLCVPDNATSGYKSLHGDDGSTHYMSQGQFVTSDGMFWGIYNGAQYLLITVDVNGYTKGPNVFGRDTFMFDLTDTTKLLPVGADNTALNSAPGGYCDKALSRSTSGLACMYYVMQGIDYAY